jgi:hypothetical protein
MTNVAVEASHYADFFTAEDSGFYWYWSLALLGFLVDSLEIVTQDKLRVQSSLAQKPHVSFNRFQIGTFLEISSRSHKLKSSVKNVDRVA